jgi:hypothetical protein
MKHILPIVITMLALAVLFLSPLIVHHTKEFVKDVIATIKAPAIKLGAMRLKQAGYVLLSRSYAGYLAGTIVELPKSTEDALIAANQATTNAGPATSGPVTTTALSGSVTVAAAAASLVVTNPNVTVQSIIFAVVAQAAADGTFLRVERVVPAAGSFTIYGTAAATAATVVDWAIIPPVGLLSVPS